ncbi:MAG: cupredoxin domain-containing protein, partial [bacterium]
GSFSAGFKVLGIFALGTAPVLLALGLMANSFKGRAGQAVTQFSGVLLVILSLWNFQNSLTLLGWSGPSFGDSASGQPSGTRSIVEGGVQIIKMVVSDDYYPKRFEIKAGLLTRWEIEGQKASGCIRLLVSKSLGINKTIENGQNIIEFTAPTKSGTYAFSCSMGMYQGQIVVK